MQYPGDVAATCSYFDPDPISVTEGTEPDMAIVLWEADTSYQTAPSRDVFGEVRSRDSGVVDGREAVAVVDGATGEGLLDEGTLTYTWVVNIAGGSFIATTHDTPERDFSRNSKLLDQIIASLAFTAPPPDDGDGTDDGDGGERTVVVRYERFDDNVLAVDVRHAE
ncbi:hypothetical protein KIF24_10285 [Micromonospora sp. Llam7]|uniref:hypothetical protein n=1 Tax=Micromonospora tarapacensis TaxID=2835305 RepID=UPI001C8359CC|nr:hypothetical protein [Micromonospora tarapacensis]MBX7266373.1 hypothetical protein [Micromonospora tarapacensis]